MKILAILALVATIAGAGAVLYGINTLRPQVVQTAASEMRAQDAADTFAALVSQLENNTFGGKIFGKFYFAVLFSVCSCFLIALSDEFLQTFIPGRGAEWLDIGMDSLGAFTGSLIAILVVFIYKKITAKNPAQPA
mgnify:CR=1 FL=1